MARKKPVAFVGDSKDRLRDFSLDAKREAGFQIDKIRAGGQPDVSAQCQALAGVMEIHSGTQRRLSGLLRGQPGRRGICAPLLPEESQQTAKDIDLGKQRYEAA